MGTGGKSEIAVLGEAEAGAVAEDGPGTGTGVGPECAVWTSAPASGATALGFVPSTARRETIAIASIPAIAAISP